MTLSYQRSVAAAVVAVKVAVVVVIVTPYNQSKHRLTFMLIHYRHHQDLLAPIQGNRNGAIVVSLKLEELWVGAAAQDAILEALAAMPFTVVWRGVGKARGGEERRDNTGDGAAPGRRAAIFVRKDELPIRALLGM